MAEDLGEILIKFGSSSGGGGTGIPEDRSQQAARRMLERQRDAVDDITASLKDLVSGAYGAAMSGIRGGGLGGVLGTARSAASGIGAAGMIGGTIGASVLAIGAGVGVIAVAALAVRSMVNSILDRVSKLAQVSPAMAMTDAMNQLAQMRRDMREAKVLGPMYSRISQLWQTILDLFQPWTLAIKSALMAIIIPILEEVADLLRQAMSIIPAVGGVLTAIGQYLVATGGVNYTAMANAATYSPSSGVLRLLGYLFPPSASGGSSVGNVLVSIGNTLTNFYTAFKNTQQGTGGQWALDTLGALATGGMVQVPGVPGALPIRTSPARRGRTQGPTP